MKILINIVFLTFKAIINKHFVERIKDKDFTDFENINWSKTEKPIIKINKPCLQKT